MPSTRTTNFETRANHIYNMINIGINDKELLMMVFTGYESKEDHFPIVLNGVKLSMTYNEVKKYNKKNKTNFKLKYSKSGLTIMKRNFKKMLELHHSRNLTENNVREFLKESDSYREFI